MSNEIPDDWYIEETGETRILDQNKVADELRRLNRIIDLVMAHDSNLIDYLLAKADA